MRALLMPMGSHGDVHPFVGLGLRLRARGHHVTILTNGHFRELVERVGLPFVEIGTDAEFREAMADPDLWHPMRGFRVVSRGMVQGLRPGYQAIVDRYVPGETVVATGMLALGARVAQDELGIPLATIQLQPMVFRSTHKPPVFPNQPFRLPLPRLTAPLLYRLADALVDPKVAPALNAFRAEKGLPPVRRVLDTWCHSPQLIVGMFPDWFFPPPPDWPPQLKLVGFPLYDEAEPTGPPPEVAAFLDEGPPPVVFTAGSAMTQGAEFFAASVEACRRAGIRGILLNRFPEQIPNPLPEGIRHFEYIPFSQVFPRAAAVAHHGGIGTTAQCLAAGVPQLVTPLAHDQFDNAANVRDLGVGLSVVPKRYMDKVGELIGELVGGERIRRKAREVAARFAGVDSLGAACESLEGLLARGVGPDRCKTLR